MDTELFKMVNDDESHIVTTISIEQADDSN